MALISACQTETPQPPSDGPPDPVLRARVMLGEDDSTPLPDRAAVVALANDVAMATASPEDRAELTGLAGQLRERLWRREGREADGQEAAALYAVAVEQGVGSANACDLDVRRAQLQGEMAQDAAVAYRMLYLAERRQRAVLESDDESGRLCLSEIERRLDLIQPFRPSPASMTELEAEGEREAETARARLRRRKGDGAVPPAASSAPTSPASPAISATPVVVKPDQSSIPDGPVSITRIEPYGSEDGARVVIGLSGPATYDLGSLPADPANKKGPRIYLDIENAKSKGIARETKVGGALDQVRVGKRKGGTRVVLDLSAPLYRRVFFLPNPFRIVVDVSREPPREVPRPGTKTKLRVERIALDPGHGGEDTGAVGPTGLLEKDVALDVAHRTASLLSHELNITTLITRDSDVFVPLEARTARANAFHADLFISVHCNASENGEAQGVQTYVLDGARYGDDNATSRLALLENTTRIDGEPVPGAIDAAIDADAALTLTGLNAASTTAASTHFAELLQKSSMASLLQKYPTTTDGGVRRARFYVLAGADMPAVLFETSFISNPEDETRLASADYRQKLADAITNAVRAYRDGK